MKTKPINGITASAISRFWKYVNQSDGCWEWTGYFGPKGYGRFSIGYAMYGAHRFSWTIHNGPIPNGLSVLHKCDNPPCVNPEHLFLGTTKDNSQDAVNKGLVPQGADRHQSKLTEEQVQIIRNAKASGKRFWGGNELARQFGVTREAVRLVAKNLTWTHLT